MKNKNMGICPCCQSEQPVSSFKKVMDEHNHQGGESCDGVGQTPQVMTRRTEPVIYEYEDLEDVMDDILGSY